MGRVSQEARPFFSAGEITNRAAATHGIIPISAAA
jgi:hypothetical protein